MGAVIPGRLARPGGPVAPSIGGVTDERPGRLSTRGRVLVAALALAAAGIGLMASPGAWQAGPGSLEVVVDGTGAAFPVEVGSTDRLEVATGGLGLRAEGGVPVDGPFEVFVSAPGRRLGLDDVQVALITPDGGRHTVPVLSQDGDDVVAGRRPPRHAGVVLALLGAVVVLWVTEFVPLFVTSLAIPVVLVVGGAASATAALSPFAHPIIVLFFAGFLMAEATSRVGLDRLAAAAIVARAGRSPLLLFSAMLAGAAFLSMWMSNTAAVTVLLPVAMAVAEPTGSTSYRRALVLGIAYASTVGGVGSAIGTPANPLAIQFIDDLTGRQVGFAEWFLFGLPMVVVFLPIMGTYLWLVSRVRVDAATFSSATAAAREELGSTNRLTRPQVEVLAVFALVMAGWLTQPLHGQPTGIVALAGAVVLFTIGRIRPVDLTRISWPTLLTFGGGLSLGVAMVDTGASDWLVTRLAVLSGWPRPAAMALVAVAALVMTTVASNTAAAATLVPLAVPLAGLVGIDPVVLVLVVALASSVDFALVIGTPPTMLAYDTGLFTAGEIMARGAPLDLAGLVVLLGVVVPFWYLVGLV